MDAILMLPTMIVLLICMDIGYMIASTLVLPLLILISTCTKNNKLIQSFEDLLDGGI